MLMRLSRRLKKAIHLFRHPVYRAGLRRGIGAAVEHEDALRPLDLASLIDVGANKGQFSLLAKALFPKVVIHAFEPLRAESERFLRLFRDDTDIILHKAALGEHTSTAAINLSGRRDSSSLLPITSRQEKLFPGTGAIGTQTISVVRGDDILSGIDLPRPLMVKLDVQGFELSALRGLRSTLERADYVYAEISFVELYLGQALADEVIDFLRGLGFRFAGVYNLTTGLTGEAVQADALFVRANLL